MERSKPIETAEEQETEQQAPKKLPCRNCKVPLTKGQYKRVADGVVCRDRASCRQRALSEELGIDLFTRYPRERTEYEMDARPENYKYSGWRAIHTEDERVMAAWIYYSWCYPVGMAYAVQIDADDEIMHDRWGQPMGMTQERLGLILGIQKPNISRATSRLEARKMLRVDDGRVYPVAKPTITAEERKVISTDNLPELGEEPSTIPKKYRHLLNDLLSDLPGDIRTDNLTTVLDACTTYNDAHKVIRTQRDSCIEQVCTQIASLLSRPITFRSGKRAGDPYTPQGGPPAQNRPVDEGEAKRSKLLHTPPSVDSPEAGQHAPLDELYDAGLGKGALGKLPSPRPGAAWHGKLRLMLKALPLPNGLDEPMFQRIARHLTEELLPQFESAAKVATGIKKWSGYEAIAKQVAARGLVKATSVGGESPHEVKNQERLRKITEQVEEEKKWR